MQGVVGALACNTGPNGHDARNMACNQAVDAGHIIPVTGTLSARNKGGGGLGTDFDLAGGLQVAHSLRGEGFDASEDGTGRGTPLVPFVMSHGQANAEISVGFSPTLNCNHEQPIAVYPINMQVRRLTPRECERLQGFEDDWTLIPVKKVSRARLTSPNGAGYKYREIDGEVWQLAANGPRYKALGNSWAVPVVRWLGGRIDRALAEPVVTATPDSLESLLAFFDVPDSMDG
jgi:DNA (cytosine-5)-methyltransferase 1